MFKHIFFASLIALGLTAVQAQNATTRTISSNIVSTESSSVTSAAGSAYGYFGFEVSVDRDPSGASIPVYYRGDKLTISARSAQNSYLYLFDVRNNGEIVQILPNSYESTNYISAGYSQTYPSQGAAYELTIDGAEGRDYVVAIATQQALNDSLLAQINSQASSYVGQGILTGFSQMLTSLLAPYQVTWSVDVAELHIYSIPNSQAAASTSTTPTATTTQPVAQSTSNASSTSHLTAVVGASVNAPLTASSATVTTVTAAPSAVMPSALTTISPTQAPSGSTVSYGKILIQANLVGALVYVDNFYLGQTDSYGYAEISSVPSGSHSVQVIPPTASGKPTYNTTVNVMAGQNNHVLVAF
ncbi:MAG: DUF4384 domain-containing protein [Deinococcales bacterium]